MNFQMSTNISRLCRICMKDTVGSKMEYIYKSPDPVRPSLHTMLSAICAPVFDSADVHEQVARESFGMPKAVCLNCKLKILAAYELYEMCIESDRKLWEMVIVQKELVDDELVKPITAALAEEYKTQYEEMRQAAEEPAEYAQEDNVSTDDLSLATLEPYRNTANLMCDLCSIPYKSKKSFQVHLKETHPDSLKCCNECDDIFLSEVQLEDHILFHRTGKKFACVVCKKRFITTSSLRMHARTHVSHTRYQCEQCDKNFSTVSALNTHMVRHAGRDVACELCPMRFYTKGSLNLHMITHTRERKFGCDLCESRFTSRDALIKHTRKHSGERPFECTECKSKFFTSSVLKRHMRTHTGERPFKCAYCDKSFRQTADLLRHSRTHLGGKPYLCDICSESFRFVVELRNHYAVHFKPGEKGATEILNKLSQKYTNDDNVKHHFTILRTMQSRAEMKIAEEEKKDEEKMVADDAEDGGANEKEKIACTSNGESSEEFEGIDDEELAKDKLRMQQ